MPGCTYSSYCRKVRIVIVVDRHIVVDGTYTGVLVRLDKVRGTIWAVVYTWRSLALFLNQIH